MLPAPAQESTGSAKMTFQKCGSHAWRLTSAVQFHFAPLAIILSVSPVLFTGCCWPLAMDPKPKLLRNPGLVDTHDKSASKRKKMQNLQFRGEPVGRMQAFLEVQAFPARRGPRT